MAVLPTPGSPMSTGLFLVRRLEHLDHAANLFVAADDGVELAAAREFGEVLGVFFERLEFAFGILVGDALRTAHGGERLEDCVVRGAERDQRLARRIALQVRDAEQQVLGGDVLVLEVRGLAKGLLESLVERLARGRAAPTAPATRGSFSSIWCRSVSSRSVGTPIFSSTAGITPSRSSMSASNRWTGCISGLPSSAARACACCIACCDLTVNLSQRIAMNQLLAVSCSALSLIQSKQTSSV